MSWGNWAVLQRTLGRSGRFSREPRKKYRSDFSVLAAVLQRIHSVQQQQDGRGRRLWLKAHAMAAHGTASIIDAWGVEPKAAPAVGQETGDVREMGDESRAVSTA